MGMVKAKDKRKLPRWLELLGVAAVSWVGAWVITPIEFVVFGYGFETAGQAACALLILPALLIPVVGYAACLAVDVFLRRGLTLSSEHQRWTAGGWFAGGAVATVAILGLRWSGTYSSVYLVLWSVFSGYAVLVCFASALLWRPATGFEGLTTPAVGDAHAQNVL